MQKVPISTIDVSEKKFTVKPSCRPPHVPSPLTRLRSPDRARLEAAIALADAAGRVVRRAEKTLAAHGLTLPQFDVLSNLVMADGLTQQGLAARLQVTKGNVCGLLDRLEKLGLVVRRPDASDGRTNRLSVTPAGRRKVDALRPLHDAAVVDLVRDWQPADAEAVQRLCSKVDPTP